MSTTITDEVTTILDANAAALDEDGVTYDPTLMLLVRMEDGTIREYPSAVVEGQTEHGYLTECFTCSVHVLVGYSGHEHHGEVFCSFGCDPS